jgi:hypothetical protein
MRDSISDTGKFVLRPTLPRETAVKEAAFRKKENACQNAKVKRKPAPAAGPPPVQGGFVFSMLTRTVPKPSAKSAGEKTADPQ